MSDENKLQTRLATHTNEELYYRDDGLVSDLMGNVSFTQMMFMHIMGRRPTDGETVILDAVLVTLMEHGLTPSAISTRLTYHSAPEALQSAVAAGLLNVGSQFVGTMENAAKMLTTLLEDPENFDANARVEIQRRRASNNLCRALAITCTNQMTRARQNYLILRWHRTALKAITSRP